MFFSCSFFDTQRCELLLSFAKILPTNDDRALCKYLLVGRHLAGGLGARTRFRAAPPVAESGSPDADRIFAAFGKLSLPGRVGRSARFRLPDAGTYRGTFRASEIRRPRSGAFSAGFRQGALSRTHSLRLREERAGPPFLPPQRIPGNGTGNRRLYGGTRTDYDLYFRINSSTSRGMPFAEFI